MTNKLISLISLLLMLVAFGTFPYFRSFAFFTAIIGTIVILQTAMLIGADYGS